MSQHRNQHHALAVGIDFGGTTIKFGICDGAKVVANAEPLDTTAYRDSSPEELIDAIAARVLELKEQHPTICAVGCGVPGLVDFELGHIHDLTNVPGWQDIQFRGLLEEKTLLPVVVDNDANCMAYAEWRHGAGAGFNHVVAVTLGTGVGGGLVIDGKLHRGSNFLAGEIGQISIDHKGAPNPYGTPGVLEGFVGNREIAQHASAKYSAAGAEKSADECTPKTLAEAAASGDEIALGVWDDYASWLGTALSSAIWLLDPQVIVIGGGVASAGAVLFDPLKERLDAILSPVLSENLQLRPARFGNEAGIVGSAAQALDFAQSA